MKNAIIVGFTSMSQSDAIKRCIEENKFECKLWISNKSDHENAVKLSSFFNMTLENINQYQYADDYMKIFDKYFHTFVHSLSREKNVDFSYFEFVNLFTIQFYYFYNFIKEHNINLLIASNFLHEADYILYAIAKEVFNLEIIIFNQTPFENTFFYVDDIEDYGLFKKMKKLNSNHHTIHTQLKEDMQIDLFYMKKTFTKRLKANCLYKFIFKDLEKIFNKKRNIKLYQLYLQYVKCRQYKNNMDKYATIDVNLDENFVYFPLHLQPELTTSIYGGLYSDQLLAIETISSFIPKNWKIYVKENPYQTYYQRDNLFFKRLMLIDKVVFIKDISTNILTKKSQFLATISGTAGWEALQIGKPTLLFGKAWYSNLPGAFNYSSEFKFDHITSYKFNKNELIEQFNDLLSNSFFGIVDNDYISIYNDYDEKQNTHFIYNALLTILDNHNDTSK